MNDRPPPSSSPPPAEAWPQRLAFLRRRWFGPLLAALAAGYVLLHAIWIVTLLPVNVDLTFPEGMDADLALRVAQERPVYQDWRQWPHQFAPYGPLTMFPPGLALRWLHAQPSIDDAYRAGRIQSMLALLGCGVLLWAMGRRMGMVPGFRLGALALVFFWLSVIEYSSSFRPDAPTAFWGLLALWFIVRGPARPWPIAGALAALMLSLWTKLSGFGFLIVVVAWIVAGQGWRRTLAIMLGFGLAGLLPALALNAHWDGLFFFNLLDGAVGREGFGLQYIARWIGALWPRPTLQLALGTAAAVYTLFAVRRRANRWLAAAALVNLAVMLLLSLKNGADINYFLVPQLLLMLALADGAARRWRDRRRHGAALREALLWGLVLLPFLALAGTDLQDWWPTYRNLLHYSELTTVEEAISNTYRPGPVLSVDNRVALKCGSEPTILDHFAYTSVIANGGFDCAPLYDRIRNETFDLVLLYREDLLEPPADPHMLRFGPGFLPLLREHYRVILWPGPFVLLEPIHRQVPRRVPPER